MCGSGDKCVCGGGESVCVAILRTEPTKFGIGIGLSAQPSPPPSLTMVFGMRFGPSPKRT